MLLRERFGGRRDVRYQFVRAFSSAVGPPLPPDQDLVFVGRPKPFTSSAVSALAYRLEGNARGRFIDPSNGTTGHTIRYERRLFSRHELEAPPEHFRRCDLDYGILFLRQDRLSGESRRLVAIGGLSTLGTLGLMLILTDDARRRQLVEEVRQVAPWHADMRPEESAEICVRIGVTGEEQLADILNRQEFTFRVEAVAIAEDATRLRQEVGAELVLIPDGEGRRGGTVRRPGAGEVRLPRARFALLRLLVEHPERATPAELCRRLGFGGAGSGDADRTQRTHLAKLVYDLNASLSGVPGLQGPRPVRFRKKAGVYALMGARGAVV